MSIDFARGPLIWSFGRMKRASLKNYFVIFEWDQETKSGLANAIEE